MLENNNEMQIQDEKYHLSSVYIVSVFVEWVLLFFVAIAINLKMPFRQLPYVSLWFDNIFNSINTEKTFSITVYSETTGVIIGFFLYWFILLIPVTFLNELFFKHLIGYELSIKKSIYETFIISSRVFLKYTLIFSFMVFFVVILKPLYSFLNSYVNLNTSAPQISMVLPLIYIFLLFSFAKLIFENLSTTRIFNKNTSHTDAIIDTNKTTCDKCRKIIDTTTYYHTGGLCIDCSKKLA